jgi:hypothetical protein
VSFPRPYCRTAPCSSILTRASPGCSETDAQVPHLRVGLGVWPSSLSRLLHFDAAGFPSLVGSNLSPNISRPFRLCTWNCAPLPIIVQQRLRIRPHWSWKYKETLSGRSSIFDKTRSLAVLPTTLRPHSMTSLRCWCEYSHYVKPLTILAIRVNRPRGSCDFIACKMNSPVSCNQPIQSKIRRCLAHGNPDRLITQSHFRSAATLRRKMSRLPIPVVGT